MASTTTIASGAAGFILFGGLVFLKAWPSLKGMFKAKTVDEFKEEHAKEHKEIEEKDQKSHDKILDSIKTLSDENLIQGQDLKHYGEDIKETKGHIEKIFETMNEINTSVKVLAATKG